MKALEEKFQTFLTNVLGIGEMEKKANPEMVQKLFTAYMGGIHQAFDHLLWVEDIQLPTQALVMNKEAAAVIVLHARETIKANEIENFGDDGCSGVDPYER